MDRKQVLAFRLHQHQLARRLPHAKLELAASSGFLIGLGAMPSVALAARAEGLREADLSEAIQGRRKLVEVSGPRAAGWLVPTRDFDAFTLGAAPETPEEVAQQAVDADVHIVGVNSLAAGHLTLVPALRSALAELGREDIMVVVGGVIPPDDVPTLLEMGAAAVFPPGTVIADAAVSLIEDLNRRLGYGPKQAAE